MKRLATIILIMIILCVGCIGTPPVPEPIPTAVITVIQTPLIPVTTAPITPAPTPTPLPTIPPAETIREPETPDPEPVPTPFPPTDTNPANFAFLNFTNNTDFKLQYPETWEVHNLTFETWDNRIVSSGDKYKREARETLFQSENNKTWFAAYVYDWIVPGQGTLNQDVKIVRNEVTQSCPDVDGYYAVTNYKYAIDDYKYMVMSYDVVIPLSSNCSPLQYSEKEFATWNHHYKFRFGTNEGTIDEYRDLRDFMMLSVKAEPQDIVVSGQKAIA